MRHAAIKIHCVQLLHSLHGNMQTDECFRGPYQDSIEEPCNTVISLSDLCCVVIRSVQITTVFRKICDDFVVTKLAILRVER